MADIASGLHDLPDALGPAVVTIGNFDGVHLGHRQILRSVVDASESLLIEAVALTFQPHPLEVVAPERAPLALTSMRQRVALMRDQGIDRVSVLHFTKEISQLSPRAFAERFLVRKLGARQVVVGANFRFGRHQAGHVDTLRSLGHELSFDVALAETVVVDGDVVSSTRVRNLVGEGRMEAARSLLGRDFSLEGRIVSGEGIGSKRTVPTLNLEPESRVLPADGVYITRTRPEGQESYLASVTNVGVRPTFNGRRRTVETYLLGPVEESAPNAIELKFLRKIRDERKFPSAQSLRKQIEADIETAERYFQGLGE